VLKINIDSSSRAGLAFAFAPTFTTAVYLWTTYMIVVAGLLKLNPALRAGSMAFGPHLRLILSERFLALAPAHRSLRAMKAAIFPFSLSLESHSALRAGALLDSGHVSQTSVTGSGQGRVGVGSTFSARLFYPCSGQPSSAMRGFTLCPRSSMVLRSWHVRHIVCRLSGSSVPPFALGVMWST